MRLLSPLLLRKRDGARHRQKAAWYTRVCVCNTDETPHTTACTCEEWSRVFCEIIKHNILADRTTPRIVYVLYVCLVHAVYSYMSIKYRTKSHRTTFNIKRHIWRCVFTYRHDFCFHLIRLVWRKRERIRVFCLFVIFLLFYFFALSILLTFSIAHISMILHKNYSTIRMWPVFFCRAQISPWVIFNLSVICLNKGALRTSTYEYV